MSTARPAALVTGGAKRIGAAIVRGLVSDGWIVALHYHGSKSEAETVAASLNDKESVCFPVHADLSRRAEIESLISRVNAMLRDRAGAKLSCLVNNANLFAYDNVSTLTWDSWEKHLVPDLYAPVFLTKNFADTIGQGEHGLVINMLDQKLHNLNPDFFSYTIGKYGLWGATRTMALALAPRIRICGIAPGITLPAPKQTPEQFERAWRKTPLGRSATTEEIVAAIRFIIATSCASGTVIVLDGGESLLGRSRDVALET